MIGLVQRVLNAKVTVAGTQVAAIERGSLVLLGVQRDDTDRDAERLIDRLLKYRLFDDGSGKMNLNLLQIGGELLLVPQFTLAADTKQGLRPGFGAAAAPELGRRLYDHVVALARNAPLRVASGRFGAHMQVSLVNDGPVTFWLES